MGPGTLERRWIDAQEWCLNRLDRIASRRSKTPPHLLTGIRGERAALFELRRRGYIIVATRWGHPKARGDVDLIAWHGDHLCFVEVKSRSARTLTPAESAVDDVKRRTLRALARLYLGGFPATERNGIPVRFDVVSIYTLGPATEIEVFPSAFPLR